MRDNPAGQRALHQVSVAELIELIGIETIQAGQDAVRRQLARVLRNQEKIMGELEDLKAGTSELVAAVTDLSGAVDRIDTDFAALESKIAAGVDPAELVAEVAKIRSAVDAAKAAKATIDTTDPTPPAPTA